MHVLGLHIGIAYQQSSESYLNHSYRDSAAALVAQDGAAVTAVEGHLNGASGTPAFPARAIRSCLAAAGVDWPDIAAIVLDISEAELDHNMLQQRLQDPRRAALTAREWIAALFKSEFGIDVADRLRFCEHSLAHIYRALHTSSPDNALCLCLDGAGNQVSGMVAQVLGGRQLKVLHRFTHDQSLMRLYRIVNGLLGLDATNIFQTMALASRGDPANLSPHFERMHQLLPDGSYSLAGESEMLEILYRAGLTQSARRGATGFSQVHLDIVAAVQLVLRRIVGHVLKHYQAQTKADTLYLCGSIAMNTEICGRVLYAGLFSEVIVSAAPDDLGNALGAAFSLLSAADCAIAREHLSTARAQTTHEPVDGTVAWDGLIQATTLEHGIDSVAALIQQGGLVGWWQNETRSDMPQPTARLLADPSATSSLHKLAAVLGSREELLRRMALIPTERLAEWVDVPAHQVASQRAAFNLRLHAAARTHLAALTWADGTALVEGIAASEWPALHDLIHAFGRSTGSPVLLGVDFVVPGSSDIGGLDDLIGYLLMGEIDGLVVHDQLMRRRIELPARERILQLVPVMANGQRLALQWLRAGAKHTIEALFAREFGEPFMAITPHAYEVLGVTGPLTLQQRAQSLGLNESEMAALADELLGLWRGGRIKLGAPAGATSPHDLQSAADLAAAGMC